jgi:hypothetical protein
MGTSALIVEPNATFQITREGDQLFEQLTDNEIYIPQGEREFFLKVVDVGSTSKWTQARKGDNTDPPPE